MKNRSLPWTERLSRLPPNRDTLSAHPWLRPVANRLLDPPLGLIGNWLRHIQDARDQHLGFLNALPDDATRWRAMCEINVIEQVRNVARTTLVAYAWKRGQALVLHGWIYGLEDGRLHDLQTALTSGPELDQVIHQAVLAVQSRYLNAPETSR